MDLRNRGGSLVSDRLTSLPIELLIRILSLLPTKDAAATCLSSKKMRHVFPWITTLDFDDSSISHCLSHPSRVESFPNYVTFVDNVLREFQSQHLTRFRLRVGRDSRPKTFCLYSKKNIFNRFCEEGCFPHLDSKQIYAWISFPLTRGLKELELRIHVRGKDGIQLPPAIFMCDTLELLKLDVNLGLDLVSTMPSFRLPNLKLLHLSASFISGEGFVTRLVSCCPLLEDLAIDAGFNHVHYTNISSSSLQRLSLKLDYHYDEYDNPDIMLFDTPNLKYLYYFDNLALQYTVSKMDSLVKAIIDIGNSLMNEEPEVSFQQLLNIIRSLSNVQHLALKASCTEDLNYAELEDQLPVFRNLKYLELDRYVSTYWDKVLLAFLNHSPILETLVYPRGLVSVLDETNFLSNGRNPLELEHKFCTTDLAIIPRCCRFHLKRIVVEQFIGAEREIDLIQFMLKHALILEELVIVPKSGHSIAELMTFKRTLQNLPRASIICSIQFQEKTTCVYGL